MYLCPCPAKAIENSAGSVADEDSEALNPELDYQDVKLKIAQNEGSISGPNGKLVLQENSFLICNLIPGFREKSD
jgi:hypothetical protein